MLKVTLFLSPNVYKEGTHKIRANKLINSFTYRVSNMIKSKFHVMISKSFRQKILNLIESGYTLGQILILILFRTFLTETETETCTKTERAFYNLW